MGSTVFTNGTIVVTGDQFKHNKQEKKKSNNMCVQLYKIRQYEC